MSFVQQFVDFFGHIIGSFWNFLFTPLVEGISLGSIIIVLLVLSLVITFFFKGSS